MSEKNLLEIKNLTVLYHTEEDDVHALSDVSLTLRRGETLGLVGETGAGKTTTALSIMRLLPRRVGEIRTGEILFEGRDLLKCTDADMRAIRGAHISMIFQDPMTSLNPTIRIGDQIAESIRQHQPDMKKADVEKRVDEILEKVGIPAVRKSEYPHQFSGGMKQRVVIAIALALEPQLLIADEPTTALDVTIQAQVLQMMGDLQRKLGTSTILITHDLGVVSQTCDRVAVMYAGEIVESGTAEDIFLGKTHHPYTEGLFGSLPDLNKETRRLSPIDGLMPDPADLPKGCKFNPRCPHCSEICRSVQPELREKDGHAIRCHMINGEVNA
ncbi:MAG: ABC transporter ATP-binding protein [Clostridia bacterium]|nr:ABC transporter ATP-binding protein [Clostridia bacterium]